MTIDFSTSKLGETGGIIELNSSDDHRDAVLALASQAKRSLYIYTHEFDRRVYDQAPFIEAVLQLALHSAQSKVLILVRDTNDIIHRGHRMIETMRRAPSRIQLRKLNPDVPSDPQEYVIADEAGVLLRRVATRYAGSVDFNAKKDARERIKHFNEVWRPSEPESKLKHLSI